MHTYWCGIGDAVVGPKRVPAKTGIGLTDLPLGPEMGFSVPGALCMDDVLTLEMVPISPPAFVPG